MWAYGRRAEYANHGASQRDCVALTFTKTLQTETESLPQPQSVKNHERSSSDSLYFFGQSATSLIFVLVLLCMVLVFAVCRFYHRFYKSNKKVVDTSFGEMQALISEENDEDCYTAI
eukprot:UN00746